MLQFFLVKCEVVLVVRRVGQFDKMNGTCRTEGGKGRLVVCMEERGKGVISGKVEACNDKHVRSKAREDIGWYVW